MSNYQLSGVIKTSLNFSPIIVHILGGISRSIFLLMFTQKYRKNDKCIHLISASFLNAS